MNQQQMQQQLMELLQGNMWVSAPIWSLGTLAMVVMLVGAFWPKSARTFLPWLCCAGILGTIWVTTVSATHVDGALGMQNLDSFAVVFDIIVLLATAVAVLVSSPYVCREGLDRGEYYALMLFSASGAMLMAASTNFVMMFLGLELLSIPLYVLAGFARDKSNSDESALKYFLLGAFASSFFLYGMALVFAATGSTAISSQLVSNPNMMLTIGLGLIAVAIAFKVALVPFHMWTPDVYQGAPTSVTAFMAVIAKAAGFGALARIVAVGLPESWNTLLWVLAAATMIWGNLIAVSQQNIKRLLAYSSIAHAGYLLMGILAASKGGALTQAGLSALLFYLLTYALMNFGAFAVVIVLSGQGDKLENLSDFRGIARRNPTSGVLMAIFMLSLAGIPPFAGFFGKLFLIQVAIEAGYVGLTVIAVMTSVIAVYYYLRVTVVMWMEDEDDDSEPIATTRGYGVVLPALGVLVLVLGILSNPILKWTDSGAESVALANPRPVARAIEEHPNDSEPPLSEEPALVRREGAL